MPDDRSLDRHLAAMARSSVDRVAATVDVDAEGAEFRRRHQGEPSPTLVTLAGNARIAPQRRWVIASAAAAVLVVGLIAISIRGGDDSAVIAPPAATISEADTSPATSSPPPSTAETALSTIVQPEGTTRATAEPATVAAGGMVTITPDGVVERRCLDIVTATLLDTETTVAQIVDGRWVTPDGGGSDVTYPACQGRISNEPVSFEVPVVTPPGTYEMCLTEPGDATGCARLTVTGADERLSACLTRPQAPPSLVDGSLPGPATIESSGGFRGARWGDADSPFAVYQVLDEAGDPSWLDGALADGRAITIDNLQAVSIPVGDPPLGSITIYLRDALEGCLRTYLVGPGLLSDDAAGLARQWVDALATGMAVTGPGHPTLVAGYVARRYIDEPPFIAVDRFDADGRAAGALSGDEVERLLAPPRLADGSILTLAEPQPDGRCRNRLLFREDGAASSVLAPGLTEARSIGVTPAGVVIATRDVCPSGSRWGDPGTRWELVTFDPASPDRAPQIVFTRDSDREQIWFDGNGVVSAGGEMIVDDISDDGRYVALVDSYHIEKAKWQVIDLERPGRLMTLASTCSTRGDIVGPPRFIGAGLIVVARLCASPGAGTESAAPAQPIGSGDIQVEAIDLDATDPTAAIVWHGTVPGLGADGYSSAAGLDAQLAADGSVWAILTAGGDVEKPSRTFVLHAGEVVEITRRAYSGFAFDPAALV